MPESLGGLALGFPGLQFFFDIGIKTRSKLTGMLRKIRAQKDVKGSEEGVEGALR